MKRKKKNREKIEEKNRHLSEVNKIGIKLKKTNVVMKLKKKPKTKEKNK